MPKPVDEDRARRRELLEQKRAARRAAKKQQEEEERQRQQADGGAQEPEKDERKAAPISPDGPSILQVPEDAMQNLMSFLPVNDLGRLLLTCKTINQLLAEARTTLLISYLCYPYSHKPATNCVGYVNICSNNDNTEATKLLDLSLIAGGDTGRILPRGKYAKKSHNEFVSYARFLQESVNGHSVLSTGRPRDPILLPQFTQGRFASVSPEHSLCRCGGDGEKSGAGGSGVASWGVGKRGQLGHGKRTDERLPRMLRGGIGYGIRIVQVSAGGGLVRVAHSLLLTSTGRVLSFGTGQYGALGHGYASGKQLPDMLRPQYVEALAGVTCVNVAAGELHSAVVTSDGDLYTWGDGFCGQLGHGDKRPHLSPRQVTKGGLEDECIANVTCGSRHTIAVTEDGEAFSWGLGHFGCLGRSYTPFDHDAEAALASLVPPPEVDGGVNQWNGAAPVLAAQVAAAPAEAAAPTENRERNYAQELMEHLELIANLSLDDSSDQCIPALIDSLKEIRIVGASAGHRHSLLLDKDGNLYSCGAGSAGCLGHGDTMTQMHPVKIASFDEDNLRVMQMSAGVDMSMAVTTTGEVYAWGKTDGGRIGLGMSSNEVMLPRRVPIYSPQAQGPIKAVDVECGYVHSLVVGVDGSLHLCGGVGVEGEDDGQEIDDSNDPDPAAAGRPRQVSNFNIWHRVPEPKDTVKKERWKKFGKYEVKGRSKMMSE